MVWAILLGAGAYAQSSAPDIVRAIDAKQSSESSRTEIRIRTYRDASNERDFREFTVTSYAKGDDASFMEFMEPRSIRGLKILSLGEDTWLYFPSTGRVRKIAGTARGESVQGVGGDFSYEDLGGGTLEAKYDFRILKEDPRTWTLEGSARTADSVYAKVVMEVAKATMLPTMMEFHTRRDGHLKTLVLSDVKVMDGKETATTLSMTNHKTGSKTVVRTLSASYSVAIPEKLLNPTQFYR